MVIILIYLILVIQDSYSNLQSNGSVISSELIKINSS